MTFRANFREIVWVLASCVRVIVHAHWLDPVIKSRDAGSGRMPRVDLNYLYLSELPYEQSRKPRLKNCLLPSIFSRAFEFIVPIFITQ